MAHSNSSLNCFANCMAKYEHNYILHTEPCKPFSPHLIFGTMAHEVLYNAGRLRDDSADGVVMKGDYYDVIPSEVLYGELKEEFNITNWQQYFTPIIKDIAEYESKLKEELSKLNDGPVIIDREIKLQLTPDELSQLGYKGIHQPLVGVVDLLLRTNQHCVIIDYKFSTTKKTQDDFDMNSQLPIYSLLVHTLYNIPLRNIKYGYIDIPKQMFVAPALLSNGTLSRAKNQNVSQEMYAKSVFAIHGDDPYYNCEPGGFYYECWCNLALNKPAYLSVQYLDMDVYNGVINDLMNAAKMVDFMIDNKMPFLKKYDAYTCKACEYVDSCKPWLGLGGNYD